MKIIKNIEIIIPLEKMPSKIKSTDFQKIISMILSDTIEIIKVLKKRKNISLICFVYWNNRNKNMQKIIEKIIVVKIIYLYLII